MIQSIYTARTVNRVLGGQFVTPWNVNDLDDVTLDVIDGLVSGLPDMQQAQQKVRSKFLEWRAKHPTYSRYRH